MRFIGGAGIAAAALAGACGLSVLGVGGPESADDASIREPAPAPPAENADEAGRGDSSAADDERDAGERDGEAGTLADASCPETGPCERILFVTNDKFRGNFGGVAGADEICRKAASTSPLPALKNGAFMAWIAGDGGTPLTRCDKRGSFVRADGLRIADSWADLVDGQIARFVAISEDGGVLTVADDDVWCAVKANGGAAPPTCLDWTTADGAESGRIGLIARTNAEWTEARTGACNVPAHLYCIEK